MLHVQISKVMCDILRAALLFYRKLQNDLEGMEIKVNPYDPCTLHGKPSCEREPMHRSWHVHDLKVSHKHKAVVTHLAGEVERCNKNKLKILRGEMCLAILEWAFMLDCVQVR